MNLKIKVICLLIIYALTYLTACASYKESLVKVGDHSDAINNAIIDFSNTTKLYSKNRIFNASLYESQDEDLLIVRIGINNMKLLLTDKVEVGKIGGKIPTMFIEQEMKLFFWYDDNYPLTKEALEIYAKYDLLQDDENGVIKIPAMVINDSQKAAHYYFCKENLRSYKKVITNRAIGYYKAPAVNCTS